MERVQRGVKTIEPHDSIERYTGLGVECFTGTGHIRSPWEVEVNGKILTTRNIVVATGAAAFVPKIPGLEDVGFMTSEKLWGMREQPERLLIPGGGPIGSELSQAFHRLGSHVIQVEMHNRILGREDQDVSEHVMKKFNKDGIDVRTEHAAKRFYKKDGKKFVECDHKGQTVEIEFDECILAIGRKPRTTGFGLQELGVEFNKNGTLKVDPYLRTTKYKNIYACGDVAGPYQFTHTAAHQAWFCAVNSMIKPFWGFKADYRVIPWCTYTDPEVARVGLNETDAKAQGVAYDKSVYNLDDLDRAITDESAFGFVKVLTKPGTDTILGVTIVGTHAGDIIAEYVTAMKYNLGMSKILGTIHIYPTLAEANKYAAGVWKKNSTSEKALKWGERINRWRR